MAADSPKLSPMADTKEMWKRRLEFIINMTSGVVYSIVMHSLIVTAYALLIFRIFYINRFDLDAVDDMIPSPAILLYLQLSALEVGLRWFNTADPLIITKSGQCAHFFGCYLLFVYMILPSNLEFLVFLLVDLSLVLWTLFVLGAFALLLFLERDDSLTQPLV